MKKITFPQGLIVGTGEVLLNYQSNCLFLYFVIKPLFVFLLNYLAHIFLSGDNASVQVGNFIGDFVKGNRMNSYPRHIRRGIRLHREIDSFTDSHTVVRDTVAMLRPHFGRYSGIVVDMYFDYFLAVDFERYSPNRSLQSFSYRFYMAVLWRYRHLPKRVRGFIFHFVLTRRLSQYATAEGLRESLEIMAHHKVSALEPEKVMAFLYENQDELREKFRQFFPELVKHTQNISLKEAG